MATIRNSIISFLFLTLIFGFGAKHDYHVSITEIEFNEEKKQLEIAQKIFIDDLSRALELRGIEGTIKQLENNEEAIEEAIIKYIKEHFQIKLKDQLLELEYVGREWEDHHALWLYYSMKVNDEFDELKIHNSLFVEEFEQQENMHYYSSGGQRNSLVLSRTNSEGTISFK